MAYLVQNLSMIRSDIRAHFSPDPTIYWLGDASHRQRASDHNPDSAGRVHAIDVMYSVGAKASAVVKACKGRPDLAYVIHNRTIWSASYGWRARRYTGTDPHTNHVHISGQHTTRARQTTTHLKWGTAPAPTRPATTPTTSKAPPFPGEMKRGSRGAGVKTFQTKLKSRGWNITADGQFGPQTERVVRAFQKQKGLQVDGKVGPKTWNAIWNSRITSA